MLQNINFKNKLYKCFYVINQPIALDVQILKIHGFLNLSIKMKEIFDLNHSKSIEN